MLTCSVAVMPDETVEDRFLQQIKAMSSTTRIGILELLRVRGPLSTRELRAQMPAARSSLAFNLGVLESAGLIRQVEPGEWEDLSEGQIAWRGGETSEEQMALRLLDSVSAHRRLGRIQEWEQVKHEPEWSEWQDSEVGRDYLLRLDREDLAYLDEQLGALMDSMKARAAAHDADTVPLVFTAFFGFPVDL